MSVMVAMEWLKAWKSLENAGSHHLVSVDIVGYTESMNRPNSKIPHVLSEEQVSWRLVDELRQIGFAIKFEDTGERGMGGPIVGLLTIAGRQHPDATYPFWADEELKLFACSQLLTSGNRLAVFSLVSGDIVFQTDGYVSPVRLEKRELIVRVVSGRNGVKDSEVRLLLPEHLFPSGS